MEVQLAVNTRKRTRLIALIVAGSLALVAVMVVAGVLAVSILTRDVRQDINLADFAQPSVPVPALEGYVEATSTLCDGVPGCDQAYESDHAAFRKFTTREYATEFAHSHTDTFQSNWIVIQYTDEVLTAAQRAQIQEMVGSVGSSE